VTLQFIRPIPNNPCKEHHWHAVAISQSALLKSLHWQPWENLDLAREPPFEKFGKHCCKGNELQVEGATIENARRCIVKVSLGCNGF